VRAVRVLQVLQPQDGGVLAHVLLLAGELRRRGWDVEVAAAPGAAGRFEEAGVPVHVLPFERAPGVADLRAVRALRRLDAARRPRIVHAHSSKAGAVARLGLGGRERIVYTPHCFAFAAGFGPARAAYWAVERALVPRTGTFVACSEWERGVAGRLAGASGRARVVRNGVPRCAPAEPHPALATARRPVAGFLARLEPQKDPLALVRAAGAQDLPGTVAIVGNGSLERAIDDEVRALGLERRVLRLPFDGSVERYLRAFDLFVLPSRWESLPIAVLEAMACGLPVVATSVGGTAEAVRDGATGRLVPPGDIDALAVAVRDLMNDAGTMGEAGARVAAEEFSVERMVDEIAAVYDELLR
jgi:glycosyltransferase involved in cell wall biosynthesis